MTKIPTPHIAAANGAFAKTVLMPGDPLRAKYIAETYLEDITEVTSIRNMLGFTGNFQGTRVSVMGAGMGMPSMGIYSHELFAFYDVDRIIRIGSAGSISSQCRLMDIVAAQAACTNSSWQEQFHFGGNFAPIASFRLLEASARIAREKGIFLSVGNVLSSDQFYSADPQANQPFMDMGVLCVEMETAALYMEAARTHKEALALLTISDEILTGKSLDAEARRSGFGRMMELALSIACDA